MPPSIRAVLVLMMFCRKHQLFSAVLHVNYLNYFLGVLNFITQQE